MTIYEANNFYKLDKKEYEIENNKDFLIWLNEQIFNGYKPFIKLDELSEMINLIVNWYEFKYPNRELESKSGVEYRNFGIINEISQFMDYKQLLFRLPHNQLCLMECGYRGKGWSYPYTFAIIKKKSDNPIFEDRYIDDSVKINHYTGIINKYDIQNLGIITEDEILVDVLVNILNEKENPDIQYEELKKVVYLHKIDLTLRKKVLELISLKLLYSSTTIPEYGYERSKKFIEEMNKEIPNLNLSTDKLDEIMTYDYSKPIENQEDKTNEPVVLKKTIFSKIFNKKIS